MELFRLVGTITVNNGQALQGISETMKQADGVRQKLSGTFKNLGEKITGAGKKLSSIGTSLNNTGTKLTKYITKPAAAAGAALAGLTLGKGWSRMVEIDNAKVKLDAIGLSGKEVNAVMNNALTSVKGTSYGLDEAATTAASAVAAGIKPGKDLEKYLTNVADAAAVAGTDMNEMGAIFNKVATKGKAQNDVLGQMAERGIPIYQYLAETIGCTAGDVFDLATEGKIDLATFQKAVETHIGGAAKTMGDKTITGTIKNIGASVGRIGQNFLGSADDANSFAGQVLPLLKDFKDWLVTLEDKAKEWGAVFGEVFRAVVTYVRSGGESFGTLSGSAQKVFDRLKPIIDVVMGIANAFLSLSPKMQGAFAVGLLSAGPLLKLLGNIFSIAGSLFNGIGKIASAFGNLKPFISGIVSIGGKLLTGVGNLITKLPLLFSIMAAHPFALIVAGIAALVAGFVYLWNHCEGFRQFWINLWENVKTVAIAVWTAITGFLSAAWGGIKAAAEAIWGGIGSFFSGLWDGVKLVAEAVWNGLSAFFSSVWNGIKEAGELIWGGLGTFLSSVWDGMKVAAETVWNGMASFLSGVWNGIKETILFALDGIQSAVSNAWNGMKSIITKVLDAIKSTVSSAWTHIKSTVTTITNGIKGFISGAWSQIKSIVTTALNGIKSVVVSIWNKIKSTITGAMNGIKSVVTSVWNSIKATVANALNSIKSAVSAIWNKIKSTITSAMNGIKSVVTGAWDAIQSKTSNVLNGIKAVFSNIWNGIKNIVANAIASIKNTISGGINNAKSIAVGALNGIKSAFSNIFGRCISVVSNAIGRIKKLFNFNWSLPKLKLPHFRINGKFSLNPPQVPHLGVEWYKKGAVLTEPAVFGLNPATGKMMAGGEAGAEAVAPIDTLMDYVRAAVREENGGLSALLEQVLAVLRSILEKELAVYLDGKEITKTVNKNLGAMY